MNFNELIKTTFSGVSNNYDKFVWEPAIVKINAIQAASEAASSVLSVSSLKLLIFEKFNFFFFLGRLDDQSTKIN